MNARLASLGAVLACLLATAAPAPARAATPDEVVLHAWRAERRDAFRTRSLAAAAKNLADPQAAPAHVGLLVSPVDFADHRLPAGWDPATLAPRLGADEGQSLRRYFTVASAGRCALSPVIAPLVHLPGVARDYSDIDLNGFTRSRRLAREALTAVATAGFDLRLADDDGPDGRPGTADDDGQVDGVLILHAEQGQENNAADGVVQALQYFLDPPVAADGVSAVAYAVASLDSGPGIWAHETAHLLGLEDRYDPLLPPDSGAGGGGDLAGAGGLGVFSLMAAGARGTGGGWNPSLPDAYSRALLGWCDIATIESSPAGGDTLRARAAVAHRVWTRGEGGAEFLLLEARDPAAVAPFDAAVPAGLVVLHVDEDVPEGSWSEDGFQQWHLRAHVVEADADGDLRHGRDVGGPGDVFPGTGGVTALTPATNPSSDGYAGPSGISVTGIAAVAGGFVHHTASASLPWLSFDVSFGDGPMREVSFAARVHGGAATHLTLHMEAIGSRVWGAFDNDALTVDVALAAGFDGLWRPVGGLVWNSQVGLPPDAWTTFRYTVTGDGVTALTDERPWMWSWTYLTLDFDQSWPGAWVAEQPAGPGTSWRRWTGVDSPAPDGSPVLVCTGDNAVPTEWPAVTYSNGGRATLTSGPLSQETAGVRILHWVDVETLPDGTPMDGATTVWVGPDGAEVPAEPLHGWPARVDATSGSALHDRGAYGGTPGEFVAGDRPLWRTDILPVPAHGTGPWRLRFEFAANDLWRGRGWVIGRCEALRAPLATSDENPHWNAGLNWDWTWASGVAAPRFDIQARTLPDSTWATVLAEVSGPVPAARLMTLLVGAPGTRHELRVVGPTLWGTLALSPVAVYADGGATDGGALGRPWPNPAAGVLRFTLQVPAGREAVLRIFDLAGRLVHARAVSPGTQFTQWDGRDVDGRRLPSGTYFMKLDGAGAPVTRKVVLTH